MFKSCSWSYLLKYICNWRPIEEKGYFRIGSHWAKCQEIMSSKPGEVCWRCKTLRAIDPDCFLCEGGGTVPVNLWPAVSRYLDVEYSNMPENFDAHRWQTERLTIEYAFSAYQTLYPDEYEVIAAEVPFSLPIIDPVTDRKLARCRLDGMIDQLWRHKETGRIYIGEQKSTGSGLENGEFWERLSLSGQVQTYSYAVYMLWCGGALKQYGLKPSEATIVTPIYDVWKKPGIKPKKLSQADSKKMLETGEYCETRFEVVIDYAEGDNPPVIGVIINGVQAALEKGAKPGTFTIHETPEMYATRLLADIEERPNFYFARKEIPVDENDLSTFAQDCAKLVKLIRCTEKEDLWLRDARSCRNPGKCDYYAACHDHRDHPLDSVEPPEGYKLHVKEETE
jgi:hypothetical protein